MSHLLPKLIILYLFIWDHLFWKVILARQYLSAPKDGYIRKASTSANGRARLLLPLILPIYPLLSNNKYKHKWQRFWTTSRSDFVLHSVLPGTLPHCTMSRLEVWFRDSLAVNINSNSIPSVVGGLFLEPTFPSSYSHYITSSSCSTPTCYFSSVSLSLGRSNEVEESTGLFVRNGAESHDETVAFDRGNAVSGEGKKTINKGWLRGGGVMNNTKHLIAGTVVASELQLSPLFLLIMYLMLSCFLFCYLIFISFC